MDLCERIVTVCGLGQLGSVFSTGLLKAGYTVSPILRGHLGSIGQRRGEPVWICVGEADLEKVVGNIPKEEIGNCIFVQNSLFMEDIKRLGLEEATCVQVWFSKKNGELFLSE